MDSYANILASKKGKKKKQKTVEGQRTTDLISMNKCEAFGVGPLPWNSMTH